MTRAFTFRPMKNNPTPEAWSLTDKKMLISHLYTERLLYFWNFNDIIIAKFKYHVKLRSEHVLFSAPKTNKLSKLWYSCLACLLQICDKACSKIFYMSCVCSFVCLCIYIYTCIYITCAYMSSSIMCIYLCIHTYFGKSACQVKIFYFPETKRKFSISSEK